LGEEADRTAHYLSTFTHPPLQDLLVAHLLTPNLQSILHMPGTGLAPMLDADRVSDLRRLYTLFLRVPDDGGRTALRHALRGDIEERGKVINEGTKEDAAAGPSRANGEVEGGGAGMDVDGDANANVAKGSETVDAKGKGKAKAPTTGGATALASALRWVQDVLDLKDKFDRVLEQAFGGDKSVQSSINEVSKIHVVRLGIYGTLRRIAGVSELHQRKPPCPRVPLIVHRRAPEKGDESCTSSSPSSSRH
jgi:cullin 3